MAKLRAELHSGVKNQSLILNPTCTFTWVFIVVESIFYARLPEYANYLKQTNF